MLQLIITFIVAIIGALIAKKLRIPAGFMIGSMIAVAVFNVISGKAFFPHYLKTMTQIISGLFIGCKISRAELGLLKRSVKPAIINMIFVISACIGMGCVMCTMTDCSLPTCLFATAPGSMVDMSIIGMEMGADTTVVSVMQIVRLVSILSLFPTFFGCLIRRVGAKSKNAKCIEKDAHCSEAVSKTWCNMGITIFVAIVSGMIGYFSGFPAGALIFSMIGVSVQNIVFDNAYMHINLKRFAQICAGALIGESINAEAIMNLKNSIIPAVILVVGIVIIVIILSFILYKTTDLDFATCLFSCAPGGASDLALIAEEYGANTPKVSIIQSVRVIMVVIIYPVVIHLLAGS